MAQKWPKMAQNDPKWPKNYPKWPKITPNGPKMTPGFMHFFSQFFFDWKGYPTNFFAFRFSAINMIKSNQAIPLINCFQGSEFNPRWHWAEHPSFGREGQRPPSPPRRQFYSGSQIGFLPQILHLETFHCDVYTHLQFSSFLSHCCWWWWSTIMMMTHFDIFT